MRRIRSVLLSKLFLIPAVTLLLYTLLGFVIAPFAIRWYAPKYARDSLHCRLDIGKVRFNPFLMSLEVKGFNLDSSEGENVAGLDRLFVDFEITSLFRWTAMFRELRLEKPALHMAIEPDGSLSLTRLFPRSPEEKPEKKQSGSIALILQSASITDGEVILTDKRQSEPVVLTFQDLDLDLNTVSTLLDQNGSYTLAAGTANGETIQWCGEIGLAPFRSSGRIAFSGIQAATIWKLLQQSVNIASPLGKLDVSTDYHLDTSMTPLQLSLQNLRVNLSTLSLALSDRDQSFFVLKNLGIECALFDFAARSLQVTSLLVDGGKLQIHIDEGGQSNLQQVVHRKLAEEEEETVPPVENVPAGQTAGESRPWTVNVESLEVKDFALAIEDLSRSAPLTVGVTSASLRSKVKIETGTKIEIWAHQLSTELNGVRLGAREAARPIFEAERLTVDEGELDLGAKTLTLSLIQLGKGHIGIERGSDGRSNIEQILSLKRGAPPVPAVRSVSTPVSGESQSKQDVQKTAQGRISQTGTGAEAAPPPEGDSPWKVNINGIQIKDIAFDLQDSSPAAPILAAVSNISIDSKVKIEAGRRMEATVAGITTQLQGVRLGSKDAPSSLFEAKQLVLEGGEVNLGARTITISRVGLSDGHIDLAREKDGEINLIHAFTPGDGVKKVDNKPSQVPPWKFLLKTFELTNFRSALSDFATVAGKPLYNVKDMRARLTQLDGQSPMGFDVSFGVEQGGKVSLRGKFNPVAQSAEVDVKVVDLTLAPLDPYIDPFITLTLQSAAFSTDGTLRYGIPGVGPKMAYDGSLNVEKLSLNQPNSGETYLGWGAMQIPKLKLALEPNGLQIEEVKLSKPVGQLIIYEDKTVNLSKIIKEKAAGAGSPGPAVQPVSSKAPARNAAKKAPAVSKSPPGKAEDAFPFNVGRIRMQDGNVVFADLSLRPKFMTRIHSLKGAVSRLSSKKGNLTEIQLDGSVDQYGMAKVTGTIDLNDFKHSTDITMVFRNVEMASVTPYSGKFAGRRIKSGKLSADLKYQIQDNKLAGDNKIIVENLVLGEHVDSPDAVNLPLDLAIALLSDSHGRIDIGLPVTGDLNDPQFSIGPLIWKALIGVITKAATAPFRALGSLFGGSAEKFDAVEFEPGDGELLPPEKEKLKKVAEALQKRPQLKLKVQGRYSPEDDGLVLRQRGILGALAERMGIKSAPNEDMESLDFSDSKTRRALEKLYVERFGSPALDELEQAVKRGEIKPAVQEEPSEKKKTKKTGRFSGMLHAVKLYKVIPGAKSPEEAELLAGEFYVRLVESEPVPEDALRKLAGSRAQVIASELQSVSGIPTDRILTVAPEPLSGEGGASAGLSLDAMSSAP